MFLQTSDFAKSRNLFCRGQKLVTHFSLRLGFDLLRGKNCIELRPILSDCRMRDRENLAGSKLKIPTVQRILERSDKSPFDNGGFSGNVDALITRKGESNNSPFLCDSVGGDGVACLSQTHKALCKLLYLHSHRTHGQIHRFSYSENAGAIH